MSDTTIEALAPILLDNPRGLAVIRDELSGWFGSFDKYTGGKGGSDSSHWLSMYGGDSLTVDRKTGYPKTIHVPEASVSINGGIPPGPLKRALSTENRESGMAARFLMVRPPEIIKQWTEKEVSPEEEAAYEQLIKGLYSLESSIDDEGDPTPNIAKSSPEAHEIWTEFYNRHNIERSKLGEDLSASFSKLEEIPLRLGLIIHLVKWVAKGKVKDDQYVVSEETLLAAIQLTEWFKL